MIRNGGRKGEWIKGRVKNSEFCLEVNEELLGNFKVK
jgi:hypothetical protein